MAQKKVTPAKKATKKAGVAKGESYVCGVCGLAVTVDEVCGCVDVCDIICCSKPMKKNATRAKATAMKYLLKPTISAPVHGCASGTENKMCQEASCLL